MAYGNLGYNPRVARVLRIYPVFLEFTEKNGKLGKDRIWQVSRINMINSKWRINFQNVPRFSIIHGKNGKSG